MIDSTNTPPEEESDSSGNHDEVNDPRTSYDSDLETVNELVTAVKQDLLKKKPVITIRSNEELENLSELEARKLGNNDAKEDPTIAVGNSNAVALLNCCNSGITSCQVGIDLLTERTVNMPDKLAVYSNGTAIADFGAGLNSTANYLIAFGGALLALLIGSYVGIELVANTGVFQKSGLDFVMQFESALTQSFGLSVGSFTLISTYIAAEKHGWCQELRKELRIGKRIFDWIFPIIGIGLGWMTLKEDQMIGWPMLIVPYSMQMLVRSALGLEAYLTSLLSLAVPKPTEIANEEKASLLEDRSIFQNDKDRLISFEAIGKESKSRLASIVETNELLTKNRWASIQEKKKNRDQAYAAQMNAAMAELKKQQADKAMEDDAAKGGKTPPKDDTEDDDDLGPTLAA